MQVDLSRGLTVQQDKSCDLITLLRRWGTNVFSADGDEWRKHRRIVGPAFNTKLWVLLFMTILLISHVC